MRTKFEDEFFKYELNVTKTGCTYFIIFEKATNKMIYWEQMCFDLKTGNVSHIHFRPPVWKDSDYTKDFFT